MHKKKITPTGALLYVFLTVVLVFMMIPFVWLLISSLRPNADLFNEPFAVPKTLSFENFRAVMESHPMLLYFANSVAIATIATVIAVGAATLAAYAMQQRFLTRKSLTVLFSMCLFIPTNAFMVPYYVRAIWIRFRVNFWSQQRLMELLQDSLSGRLFFRYRSREL